MNKFLTNSKIKNRDEIQIFKSDKFGKVRTLLNEDGSISINAEDTARGFGWVQNQIKNGRTYSSIRWERINNFIKELGFHPQVGEGDYIPESLFYLLGMKANNDTAKEFQSWLAVDVLPEIRKNGLYKMANLSPELQAIFSLDGKQQQIDLRVTKLENNMTIDYSQQEEIRTLGTKKVLAVLGGKGTPAYKELNKKAFSSLWRDYKRIMAVNSYKNTPVRLFEDARKMIINWQPNRELELMIKGCNSQY